MAKNETVATRVNASKKKKLEEKAKEKDMEVSEVVRDAIDYYLDVYC